MKTPCKSSTASSTATASQPPTRGKNAPPWSPMTTGCSPRSHSADTFRSWSSPSRGTSSSADWARKISQSCPRISSGNSGNASGCRRHSSACSGRWQSSRWMTEQSRNKIPRSEKIPSRPEKTGRAWFNRRSLWDTERCLLMARGNTAADTFWMIMCFPEITIRQSESADGSVI